MNASWACPEDYLLNHNLDQQFNDHEYAQIMESVEITNQLSYSEFEKIKEFTLKKGDIVKQNNWFFKSEMKKESVFSRL